MLDDDCKNCGGKGYVIVGLDGRRGCPICYGRGTR